MKSWREKKDPEMQLQVFFFLKIFDVQNTFFFLRKIKPHMVNVLLYSLLLTAFLCR